MKNKNVLISNGPTRVYIDPIRYISNISSGKMGKAFIDAFLERGANVRVVSGKVDIKYPKNAEVFYIETNNEMLDTLNEHFSWADIFISVAAVVDFEPIEYSQNKIKKIDKFSLNLKKSEDILSFFSLRKRRNQIVIGFALETDNLFENAKNKIIEKNLDYIIANEAKNSMGLDTAVAYVIDREGICTKFDKQSKGNLAKNIIDFIF